MSDDLNIPVKVVDRRRWRENGEANPDAADQPSLKPTYVEELERRAAQAEQQAQEFLGKYRGAAQEFEDARARMRKEVAKDAERSRREVFISLLEVLDNLDRAIEAARKSGTPGSDVLLQGVEMVRQQFLAKLEGFGVKRIASEHEPFDPELHEAVTTVPTPDAASDGRVLGVIAHGYRIGDDVLRPALVAVGRKTDGIDG
ncbi:MAG TPA: nucleotide exchange factor GrpE [Vicinamibacterales bacterium]|jgi:molecular chaperone GrpE